MTNGTRPPRGCGPGCLAANWTVRYIFPGPLVRLIFLHRAEGTDRVPTSGPAIIAGNHLSVLDPVLIQLLLRRRVVFLAKRQFFTRKGPLGFLIRQCIRLAGIPVDRRGGRSAAEGLGGARQILADGGVVGIFPEGTLSPDGRLYRGHTGAVRLALDTGAPIVPVATRYPNRIRLPRQYRSQLGRATVVFGEPMALVRMAGACAYRHATDVLMQTVQRLSGQEYVDVYAPWSGD